MVNPLFVDLGREPRGKKPHKAKPSPSHLRARKQEKEAANRLHAEMVPGSGARDTKGDVRLKRVMRLECKTTKNASFSVTLDMVRKIEEAAASAGEVPALLIEFNDGNGKRLCEVAVVPSYVLDHLCR